MVLNSRIYDTLKFVALVLLPAAAAGYFSLAQVLGLPNSEQVVGTMTVVDTFLGLILKASTSQYNKNGADTDGDLIVEQVDGERYLGLGVNKSSFALMTSKDTVTLRVVDNTRQPKVRVADKTNEVSNAPVDGAASNGPVGGHYN